MVIISKMSEKQFVSHSFFLITTLHYNSTLLSSYNGPEMLAVVVVVDVPPVLKASDI